MERLTARDEFGTPYYPYCDNVKGCGGYCAQCNFETKTMDKLAQYEELEEQELLLRLPCKVGDTVYIISRNNEIISLNVYGINIRKDDFTILVKNEKYYGYSILSLLGKYESVDWFITQAEAEQKLKEISK